MPTAEQIARGDANGSNGRGKHRGSTDNARRLDAFRNRKATGSADWGACDPGRIQDAIVKITGLGGAITFSLSRDGGAHGLTLLLDSERQTLWFNGDADLDEEMEAVIATLDTLS